MQNVKSSFKEEKSKNLIEAARLKQAPLEAVIGNVFKLVREHQEVKDSMGKHGQSIQVKRDVVEVQTLNSRLLPIGTTLVIKIKDFGPIVKPEDQKLFLLGVKQVVVVFDDLLCWNLNGTEGLSASAMHLTDLNIKNVLGQPITNN